MKFVLYTSVVSPHQLPLARELLSMVGRGEFYYIYTEKLDAERANLGWHGFDASWLMPSNDARAKNLLEHSDVLLSGIRDVSLFELRAKCDRRTFYMSERWFKPSIGILRIFMPSYFRMSKRLIHLLASGKVVYLPTGVVAASDMVRLYRIIHFNLRFLFSKPRIEYSPVPMGVVKHHSWMRMWGYFVAPSAVSRDSEVSAEGASKCTLKVLWVGRMLKWKRVDTILKAVTEVKRCGYEIACTLVGEGPERPRLKKMADKLSVSLSAAGSDALFNFCAPVRVEDVRVLMRQNDLYILASNGYEGWGAALNEAMEEGMSVLGTQEAGSSATLLLSDELFHAGDWKSLAHLIMKRFEPEEKCGSSYDRINGWAPKCAAKELFNYVSGCEKG